MITNIVEPKIVNIKNGWAAVANDWAVFGSSEEEVLKKFCQAKQKHIEIESRIIEKPLS